MEQQLTDEDLKAIFVEVTSGAGGPGDFVLSFARCYCMAGPNDRAMLKSVALTVVKKYNLSRFLKK